MYHSQRRYFIFFYISQNTFLWCKNKWPSRYHRKEALGLQNLGRDVIFSIVAFRWSLRVLLCSVTSCSRPCEPRESDFAWCAYVGSFWEVSKSSFALFCHHGRLRCSFVSSEQALEECGLQLYNAKLHIFIFKRWSQKKK